MYMGYKIKNLNMRRKILILISIVFVIIVTLYFIPRYGWRLYGFKYCSNPSDIVIGSVTINYNENFVNIFGETSSSLDAYVGKIYKKDGDTLYIGIKYNSLFGFFKRDGSFDIKIAINVSDIEKVIITNNQENKTIYMRGSPQYE